MSLFDPKLTCVMSSEVRDSVLSVRCSESLVPQLADRVDSGPTGVLLRLLSVEQARGWRRVDRLSRPDGSDSARAGQE